MPHRTLDKVRDWSSKSTGWLRGGRTYHYRDTISQRISPPSFRRARSGAMALQTLWTILYRSSPSALNLTEQYVEIYIRGIIHTKVLAIQATYGWLYGTCRSQLRTMWYSLTLRRSSGHSVPLYSVNVSECKRCLNELAELLSVGVIWVPGHNYISGNFRVNKLAWLGTIIQH